VSRIPDDRQSLEPQSSWSLGAFTQFNLKGPDIFVNIVYLHDLSLVLVDEHG
jgi:hypothetical protein